MSTSFERTWSRQAAPQRKKGMLAWSLTFLKTKLGGTVFSLENKFENYFKLESVKSTIGFTFLRTVMPNWSWLLPTVLRVVNPMRT